MDHANERTGDSRPAVIMLVNSLGVGGAERQTIALANKLADRFRVVLAYLKSSDSLATHVGADRLAELRCLEVRSRVDLRAARELVALAAKHDARVILCANTYPLLYAQLARALSRRALTVIEVFHTTKLRSWKERLAMLFYRPLFWASHHLVYVCDAQHKYWRRRGLWARRSSMIYNGVNLQHYDPVLLGTDAAGQRSQYGFAAADRVVGICAVLRPEKAHADLLKAVGSLKAEGEAWKILIIGDGPLRAAVEQQAVALGLADDVVVTGYLSDVRAAVSACDVMALVSTAIETFSIAALEAMAMGKPMIMSDIGGAREQVLDGQTGYVFPAGDVRALAACLRHCTDRARLAQMGEVARKRVQDQFSEDRMVEHYARLLLQAHQARVQPVS